MPEQTVQRRIVFETETMFMHVFNLCGSAGDKWLLCFTVADNSNSRDCLLG